MRSPKFGPDIWRPSRARRSAIFNSKPIARGFSVAGSVLRSAVSVNEGLAPVQYGRVACLIPIFSLRRRVRVAKGETVRLCFWTSCQIATRGSGHGRQISRSDRLRPREHPRLDSGPGAIPPFRALDPTRRISSSDSPIGFCIPTSTLRPPPDVLKRGGRNLSALWAHGISGDLPIVVLRIDAVEEIRHRPSIAARLRVLAAEAARGRRRHPE